MHDPDNRELLEKSILEALKVYSNVHRGSGHKSIVSTALFEHSRQIVLEHLGLDPRRYLVIFCTPYQAELLVENLGPGNCQVLSSASLGMSTGVRAVVVRKRALPREAPPMSGGGTARLISTDWVIWDKAPAKYEAGTPAVINIIAFARALQLAGKKKEDIFRDPAEQKMPVRELLYKDPLEGLEGEELLNRFRETRIGLDLQVPTVKGNRRFINLDSSASTPTFGPVWDAFRKTIFLNHRQGGEILSEVRQICNDFLGAPSRDYEIIFTGNATEGVNLVAGSLAGADTGNEHPVVVGTLMEHSSNDLPWRSVPNHTLIRIPVDMEGFIDIKELERLLEDYNEKGIHGNQRIRLVAVSAASNVLGTCNNLKEISDTVHRYGVQLLVDGAQLVAHRKAELAENGIDYFVCSAHKIYAPFGSGLLVVRKGLLRYTTEQSGKILASGEENLAGIAALGKALQLLGRMGMDLIEKEERVLTALALEGMDKIPGMNIVGIRDYQESKLAQRVGVIPFNLGNMVSFSVGKKLALHYGIGVRVGCHCAHILVKHVLGVGLGLERFQRILQTVIPAMSFPGVARVSLGIENTKEEVDALLKGLRQISMKSRDGAPEHSRKELKKISAGYTEDYKKKVFGSQF